MEATVFVTVELKDAVQASEIIANDRFLRRHLERVEVDTYKIYCEDEDLMFEILAETQDEFIEHGIVFSHTSL